MLLLLKQYLLGKQLLLKTADTKLLRTVASPEGTKWCRLNTPRTGGALFALQSWRRGRSQQYRGATPGYCQTHLVLCIWDTFKKSLRQNTCKRTDVSARSRSEALCSTERGVLSAHVAPAGDAAVSARPCARQSPELLPSRWGWWGQPEGLERPSAAGEMKLGDFQRALMNYLSKTKCVCAGFFPCLASPCSSGNVFSSTSEMVIRAGTVKSGGSLFYFQKCCLFKGLELVPKTLAEELGPMCSTVLSHGFIFLKGCKS